MIDGLLPPRRRFDSLPPKHRQNMSKMVVGDHTKDKFRPPEEIAAEEEQRDETDTSQTQWHSQPQPEPKQPSKNWFKKLSRKQKVLLTVAAVIIVAGAAAGSYFAFFAEQPHQPAPVIVKQQPKPEPKPTTAASSLSGLQVDPSVNDRPLTAIMIENSESARPQSGLNQASVVFEAIAEGGITRFVALFQDTEPDYIGPVRSARPYYITWLLGFDAAYAHAGGSAEALSLINQWHVKNLPDNSSYFWRINSRPAPHNLYTSIAKLHEYEAAKGFGKPSFTPLPRKAKEEPAATPTAKTIDFNISGVDYNVHYDYDASSNSYKRSEGGEAHFAVDQSGNKVQLSPKVVVALIMPQGRNGLYYTYQTIGSGQALIFQDGTVTSATWHKDNNNANLTFTDPSGATVGLNPGQTWFTALGDAGRVTYKP